jgi:hypothetical protein
LPGAAAFLLDLSPGLDAATGPEPGTSRVLVPCYLFIETAAPVRTKGFGQYSSASAQMDDRRWQARRGSARPIFLWLGLRTHSISCDLPLCNLLPFSCMLTDGICGASPHPPAIHPQILIIVPTIGLSCVFFVPKPARCKASYSTTAPLRRLILAYI